MNRREFSAAASLVIGAAALGLPGLAFAQRRPEEGKDYLRLDKQVPVDAPAGKIELIEFFWYSCPHCNAFEPKLNDWLKTRKPADVAFRRVPVAFRDDFVPEQRLYYTLEALGKVDELHGKVFQEIHQNRNRLNREDAIVAFAGRNGLDEAKFKEFMESGGASLIDPIRTARDRFSAELDFEQAQRQHERLMRIEQALKLRDDLATAASRLSGVAVYPSLSAGYVELYFMLDGLWLEPVRFSTAADAAGTMAPLDRRLRELYAALSRPRMTIRDRAEHVALLARWYYSSFRDADWIAFEPEQPPYRRLVRAISKAASGAQAELF